MITATLPSEATTTMIVLEKPTDMVGAVAGFRQLRRLSDRFFTLSELQDYLGVEKRQNVRDAIKRAGIPYIDMSGEMLLSDAGIEQIILAQAASASAA